VFFRAIIEICVWKPQFRNIGFSWVISNSIVRILFIETAKILYFNCNLTTCELHDAVKRGPIGHGHPSPPERLYNPAFLARLPFSPPSSSFIFISRPYFFFSRSPVAPFSSYTTDSLSTRCARDTLRVRSGSCRSSAGLEERAWAMPTSCLVYFETKFIPTRSR
jgi:hypothetical protein